MNISDFDYDLPKNLIAQSPTSPRDHSKLLRIDRKTGKISHYKFFEIEKMLSDNDVLVLNKTKVFPARFYARKDILRLRPGRAAGGGKIEVLLIEEIRPKVWKALTKPGLKVGQTITFKGWSFKAVGHEEQTVLLKTDLEKNNLLDLLQKYGKTPLPPYIHNEDPESSLRMEYQTIYAKDVGSVAAPTAGFHFTKSLLDKIKKRGVQIEYVTLHVGLGTFAPVKTKKLEDHPMHFEYFEVERDVAERLNLAKKLGKRIVSVGTTSTRVLETVAICKVAPCKLDLNRLKGSTNLFIYPGYKFKFVDALITNLHLPKSTLLALVYTFAGSDLMKKAYQEAIKNKYRFFSFGDASLIE